MGPFAPKQGDFLMAVDTNVGFNKNERSGYIHHGLWCWPHQTGCFLPSLLTVVHKNKAAGIICKQWDKVILSEEQYYPDYRLLLELYRIYTLVERSFWMPRHNLYRPIGCLLNKMCLRAWIIWMKVSLEFKRSGTLQVVPGAKVLVTTFHFNLPAGVVQSGIDQSIYHLLIQKQPGTLAEPITIRVHLPNNASIQIGSRRSSSSGSKYLISKPIFGPTLSSRLISIFHKSGLNPECA